MLHFIKRLTEMISAMTNEAVSANEPKESINENEKELLVLDEEERRAYTLFQDMTSRLDKLMRAHLLKHLFNSEKLTSTECDQFHRDCLVLLQDLKLTNDIIWMPISEKVKNCPSSLSVRKGWKIVEGSEKTEIGIMITAATPKFPPHMCN
jgi:hypothetical protein